MPGCQNGILLRYQNMTPCEKLSYCDSLYSFFGTNCQNRLDCKQYPYCIRINKVPFLNYVINDIESMTGHTGRWIYILDYSGEPSFFADSIVADFDVWRKALKCEGSGSYW